MKRRIASNSHDEDVRLVFLVAPVNNKKNELCIAFHAKLVGNRTRIFGMVQTLTLLTVVIFLRDFPGLPEFFCQQKWDCPLMPHFLSLILSIVVYQP
jgi:hypothetical protein